jgi:two-component system, chemotaxis family, sensor kinase Cph1
LLNLHLGDGRDTRFTGESARMSPSPLPFPYSVKRHGVSITNCDDEPVRTPGCIQGHGLLLAVRPNDLVVTQASDNWPRWTGQATGKLLGQTLSQVLGSAVAQRVQDTVRNEVLLNNPLYVLTTKLPGAPDDAAPLDISAHIADGVLLLELEPTGRSDAASLAHTDYYSVVKKTLMRLKAAPSLAEFCNVAAQEARRITQLDRVMIYRFHADDTGEVLADAHRDGLHSWLGLRYPASDIPKPAREILKQMGVRPLPDANGEMFEMQPLLNPDTGRPLDMTYCALRGASVMYTEYLRNMGVAATLTMPILRNGDLWGLIACHHHTATHFPYPVRAAAEFLGHITSLEVVSAESREHLQYRLRLDTAHHTVLAQASADNHLLALTQGQPSLLDGIHAGGVAVSEHKRWATAGHTPPEHELDALAEWLGTQAELRSEDRPVFVLDALGAANPAAKAFADTASGLLAIPISQRVGRAGGDWVMWFRPEQVQTFTWGGNPHEKPSVVGPHGLRLTPRKSFDTWQEQVNGRSVPWKTVEVDAALKLRLLLLDIVVSRAEELALLNTDLLRSNDELDAFAYVAGHDLKEPLRGIHKHAHQLVEDAKAGRAMDARGRERVESLLRLTVRMDNLLDALLHFSRVGRLSLEQDEAPLDEVLAEAMEMLDGRLADSGIQVRVPQPLPVVRCDRIRVREIFANLIANALKYNDKPQRWVEIAWWSAQAARPLISRAGLEDSAGGQPVFCVQDNGIGIEERHRERVFLMFKRLHPRDAFGGGSGAGLAIVKKLVEQHQGRLWFESVPSVGTRFYFTLAAGERQTGITRDD